MSRPLNPALVIRTVAEWFSIEPASLKGHNKLHFVAFARRVSMYLLREDGRSLKEVAAVFHRHHSSVLSACRKVQVQQAHDPEFSRDLAELHRLALKAHNPRP